MPYVICDGCELVTYSAALWASTEECPRCGAQLPAAARHDGAAEPVRGNLRLAHDDDE